ncbi:hypothetical protein AYO38_03535 [bacterium SCGC AG-212-C10]|nr:hypothetical protein AYO38_03535 [bacterium SCGC AG-212-C10]
MFFGQIDGTGKEAIEAWANFSLRGVLGQHDALLTYMGTQKLRTPKGLSFIAQEGRSSDRDSILSLMVANRRMYAAIWSECVWMVADASDSSTKFILSDHPVTVYNRSCGPKNQRCRGASDPDLTLSATHTLFPLSLDKILILTNLTWARNPYQDPLHQRPNPLLNRSGIFKPMNVLTERYLNEQEVLEINFIIRSRAFKYIAAGEREWLYPEHHISKAQWAQFGKGYLLMPDPRALHMGGTVYLGYRDGRPHVADEYGRRPWQPGFETDGSGDESVALERFKGEFARLFGPRRRGRVRWPGPGLEPEQDDDESHKYHLGLEEENRKLLKGKRYG